MPTHDAFQWPNGKRAALSLSYDDARLTQVDNGIPILDSIGIKATFYVVAPNVEKRLDVWRAAVRAGHEIGCHTLNHPCTGNFGFSRDHALEDYSLDQMEAELTGANAAIEKLLGVRPETFAYPCGQKFVGRGERVQSYVPLVARHFIVGRGFCDEYPNDPLRCDLAQAGGMDMDRQSADGLKGLARIALDSGGWVILCGHEMGIQGRQATDRAAIEEFGRYLADPGTGLWVDTVLNIGRYIQSRRGTK